MPTWILSNASVSTTTRYHDTTPLSPSGLFVALLRFPSGAEGQEVRVSAEEGSAPLRAAEVVVVDVAGGREIVVAMTRGWDSQTGAHVQWGDSDQQLFFNDVVLDDHGVATARGVKLDPFTGMRQELECTVYHVSPAGAAFAVSPCLRRIGRTQRGYGVHVPGVPVPINRRAEPDDGLFPPYTLPTRHAEARERFAEVLTAAADDGEHLRG